MPLYRIAPGVDLIPLGDESILFRSSTLAVKLEGGAATMLRERVIPLLRESRAIEDLAGRLPGIAPEALRETLESLVKAQVLIVTEEEPPSDPLSGLAQSLQLDAVASRNQLRAARIAIFGLEGHGGHLASELCRLGIGSVVLADDFPLRPADRFLLPALSAADGVSRQVAVGGILREQFPDTAIEYAAELSRESVEALAESCTLLVGCFDRGYETAQHWVNRASITKGRPALYLELGTHVAMVGPYVIPGETACYMCYRMRRLACEQNYDEAMAYEKFLNQGSQPILSVRATAPFLPAYASSLAAAEIVKVLALGLPPALASQMLEFDSFTFDTKRHAILRQPECPVCRLKKKPPRLNPTLPELSAYANDHPSGDLNALGARLVSPRTGVVKHLEAFVKDSAEPAIPYVFRADISNHRFRAHQDDDNDVCSGKGMTVPAARVSALGEAVERYSSALYSKEEVLYGRRRELEVESLDPRDLVLFHPSQYEDLPYAPYSENRLGWIPARSLVTGREILVPAIAVFMNYGVHAQSEFLAPITSNGLATGRTLPEAILAAAIEVLERDAFMLTWLHRLPTQCYSPLTHPDREVVAIAKSYRRRGVEIRLYRLLDANLCSVFAAVALESAETAGPSAVFGLGAAIEPADAARKAVLEVCQVRPALRKRLRRPEIQARLAELLDDPRRVLTIDDHDLLYASPRSRPKIEFLLGVPEQKFELEPKPKQTAVAQLSQIVSWLGQTGSDLLYVNLTPPDMFEMGLYTVRAILPGFQPIDFGWHERRLGGDRLYRFPMQSGFRAEPAAMHELNPDPHPLA